MGVDRTAAATPAPSRLFARPRLAHSSTGRRAKRMPSSGC